MLNRNFSIVKEILKRKEQGIDCTEEESAKIKGWLKETLLSVEDDSVDIEAKIQSLFPLEYGEYLDETGQE